MRKPEVNEWCQSHISDLNGSGQNKEAEVLKCKREERVKELLKEKRN